MDGGNSKDIPESIAPTPPTAAVHTRPSLKTEEPSAADVTQKSTLTWAAEVSQIIGVMLAIIGLVSVVWQLRGLRQATETTALIGIYAESNEINRFLVERPEFREHFYADDPNERGDARNARLSKQLDELRATHPVAYRALVGVAELEADQFEQVFGLRETMPSGQWNVWWAYFADTYDASPLLRTFYDRNREWYELDDFLRIGDRNQRRSALLRRE